MERPQTGQDRSSTSKVIRLNTLPAGQRYAMGMPSYFSSLSMLNAKKPLPHHHDMQGKTILAFRRIVHHNTCITNHHLTAANVVHVAQASRGRWKIENENNNVLKTKGYHLEHNFGHGQQYLAAVLLSLNLLAFLFHTVLEWSDDKYALLRQVLARRQTFFNDIQALMRYMVFDSWDHLIHFMIRGLELESQCDTS